MKTTIELSDDLLERARSVARREGTTLWALVEEGPCTWRCAPARRARLTL